MWSGEKSIATKLEMEQAVYLENSFERSKQYSSILSRKKIKKKKEEIIKVKNLKIFLTHMPHSNLKSSSQKGEEEAQKKFVGF